jgi:hypothetical protein
MGYELRAEGQPEPAGAAAADAGSSDVVARAPEEAK